MTLKELEDRLREAVEVQIRMKIDHPGPKPPRAISWTTRSEWCDWPSETTNALAPPSGAEIDRADECWQWLSWLRTNASCGSELQRDLMIRILVARASLFSFQTISDMISSNRRLTLRQKISRETCRRIYHSGLESLLALIEERRAA